MKSDTVLGAEPRVARPCMRLIRVAACGALFVVSLVGQAEEISASGEQADWPSAAFAPNGDLWFA